MKSRGIYFKSSEKLPDRVPKWLHSYWEQSIRVPVSQRLHQHLLSSVFPIMAILIGVRWNLKAPLISTPQWLKILNPFLVFTNHLYFFENILFSSITKRKTVTSRPHAGHSLSLNCPVVDFPEPMSAAIPKFYSQGDDWPRENYFLKLDECAPDYTPHCRGTHLLLSHTLHHTLHTTHSHHTLHTTHSTMHTPPRTLQNTHSHHTLHTPHRELHTAHSTMQTVLCGATVLQMLFFSMLDSL